jgi:hypothetical protein
MVDQPNPVAMMHRLLAGGHLTRIIQAAAELGLADRLGANLVDVPSLAEATGTHAASLGRLLRALAAIGIVQETDDRRYTLTSLGRTLRSGVPGSMRAWARLLAHETTEQPWQMASDVVRTGEAAFPAFSAWMGVPSATPGIFCTVRRGYAEHDSGREL